MAESFPSRNRHFNPFHEQKLDEGAETTFTPEIMVLICVAEKVALRPGICCLFSQRALMLFVALEIRSTRWIGGDDYAWRNQVEKGLSTVGQTVEKGKQLPVFAAGPRLFLCLHCDLAHGCWVRWVSPNTHLELPELARALLWCFPSSITEGSEHPSQALAAALPGSHHRTGIAAHPRDVTAAVGAELLQTLTFPKPWESETRPAPREGNAGTTQALGLLCSEQGKTNISLLN